MSNDLMTNEFNIGHLVIGIWSFTYYRTRLSHYGQC